MTKALGCMNPYFYDQQGAIKQDIPYQVNRSYLVARMLVHIPYMLAKTTELASEQATRDTACPAEQASRRVTFLVVNEEERRPRQRPQWVYISELPPFGRAAVTYSSQASLRGRRTRRENQHARGCENSRTYLP
jgi:hypothetical protein